MIEIIIGEVKMPPTAERRYKLDAKWSGSKKWNVIDSHDKNSIRYSSVYTNAVIACYNLNKKFYRDDQYNQ